jgi:D-hexose-6-phosphate mutarotase
MTSLFAAIVAMTNMCGVVSVDTHGARVVSYIPRGGEEVFFVSETGTGGMPLCWPWFGGNGPYEDSRRHGIARYMDFEVIGTEHIGNDSTLTLQLKSDEETRKQFPHDFTLTVKVRMNDRLTVSMIGTNTGKEPFAVTEALHPYFAVSDSEKCIVENIDSDEYRLVDPARGWMLSFTDEGERGRHIWRPNPKSHLSKSVSSIQPDDWRRFICVENGTFKKEDAYILKPGESHTLTRVIRLTFTHGNAKPNPKGAQASA